jgi:NADH:ubiquinone oxidoreductase subunit 5 (subunit L)/multisubunit Na+/H+ antiporter MnhA subunit
MMSVALPLIALMAGVVGEIVVGRWLPNKARGWLALVSALVALGGVMAWVPAVMANGSIELSLGFWDSGIPLVLHIDGLSLLFSVMGAGIGAVILLYCIGYMQHESGTLRFYALMLTFIAGLIGLVVSANLLVAYFCWEIIGLCSYFLVGFWYTRTEAAQGARKVLVMTHIAGYAFLVGILLLNASSGSFLWTDPKLQAAFGTGIFLLLLVAAMAKSVLFPLHTWIPEAMNAPTPVSALLHSACYVKAGVYLIVRLYSISPWQPAWNIIVMILGLITMIVGAIYALSQTDLKRLLAYSTISQIGHILTAFSLGTPLGIAAGIFYTFSHGLFKGTLFLCAGSVQHAAGTRDMRRLGGLAARMPVTATCWLVAAAAIIGVPLANGFVAKWLLLDAALASGQAVVVVVTWLISILTAFYMLKATASVFFGALPPELAGAAVKESGWEMRLGMGILAALCLLFGIAPQLLFPAIVEPAAHALGFTSPLQLSWLGLHAAGGSLTVTAGAFTILAALLIGALALLIGRPARAPLTGSFTGGDPLPEMAGSVGAVDFTALVETSLEPAYAISNPDPLYRWGWRALTSGSRRLARAAMTLENNWWLAAALLAALAAIVVWVL